MGSKKVGVIIGSLRKESWNRKMAQALIRLAPSDLSYEIIEIGQLPHYNEDLDKESPPKEWVDFRARLAGCSAFLFCTPEYNRSVPGVLKNAIDVGSRPYGKNQFDKKPAGIVSVSPGAMGAFGANHHLRQALVFLNMPTMAQPEAYIGNAAKIFEADGTLVEATRGFMEKFMQAFTHWVLTHL